MPRRTTPTPPKLRTLRLPELTAGAPAALRAHGTYEALTFTGDDLTGMDLTNVGFTDCALAELNVHELELTSARITDTRLHHLDIPTVSAAYAALRGLVLEEGTATSHVAIVARALGIPAVGEVPNAVGIADPGDAIIVDGTSGSIYLRPSAEIESAYAERVRFRARRQAQYIALRDRPAPLGPSCIRPCTFVASTISSRRA